MAQPTATTGLAPARDANTGMIKLLSHICFVGGFISIIASILVWVLFNTPDVAHRERFGIFIGLWAPTFFALSDRLDRYVTSRRV